MCDSSDQGKRSYHGGRPGEAWKDRVQILKGCHLEDENSKPLPRAQSSQALPWNPSPFLSDLSLSFPLSVPPPCSQRQPLPSQAQVHVARVCKVGCTASGGRELLPQGGVQAEATC